MMSPKEQSDLKTLLSGLSLYYREKFADETLAMYTHDLRGFAFWAVKEAIEKYRQNPVNKRFPLPAQLIDILQPQGREIDDAREVANRIVAAIVRHGYIWPDGVLMDGVPYFPTTKGYMTTFEGAMQEEIGTLGIAVVQLIGGWVSVCKLSRTGDEGMLYSRLRDLAESVMRKAKAGTLGTAPSLPGGPKTHQLASPDHGSTLSRLIASKKLDQEKD